jgi:hypothetical protein
MESSHVEFEIIVNGVEGEDSREGGGADVSDLSCASWAAQGTERVGATYDVLSGRDVWADDCAWYTNAHSMPLDRTPFQAQEDAVLVRHVVSAVACRNLIAEADGSIEGLLRSPQVLADRARKLFGQAIDVNTSNVEDGPEDELGLLERSSARGM